MYEEDYYNPADPNDYDDDVEKIFEKSKKLDKGYNVVYRKVLNNKNGKWQNKKISVYTSSGIGTRIRDAESGEYFPNYVGSKDEDLFFKVSLSTCECKIVNGYNTLFYLSPQHYMNHLHCEISPDIISKWEEKRNATLVELKYSKRKNANSVIIH
jgi:hypothetical protein